MKYIAIGTFTPESVQLLNTVCQGAPLEYYRDPFLFVSDPLNAFDADAVAAHAHRLETTPREFVFSNAVTVYNLESQRSEFALVGQPNTESIFDEAFYPYFILAQDPNRSTHTRDWLTSISDVFAKHRERFFYTVRFEQEDSIFAQVFNPYVQEEFVKRRTI